MALKPYQSSLNAYEDEILGLRFRTHPMPYSRIAGLLSEKYGLKVCRETVYKFVKSRHRRRREFSEHAAQKKGASAPSQYIRIAPSTSAPKKGTKFEFTYSDRYNLTRLSLEEAEALKKKLEEEKH